MDKSNMSSMMEKDTANTSAGVSFSANACFKSLTSLQHGKRS